MLLGEQVSALVKIEQREERGTFLCGGSAGWFRFPRRGILLPHETAAAAVTLGRRNKCPHVAAFDRSITATSTIRFDRGQWPSPNTNIVLLGQKEIRNLVGRSDGRASVLCCVFPLCKTPTYQAQLNHNTKPISDLMYGAIHKWSQQRGREGLSKIWRSKGGCVILVLLIGPKCWQGGEGVQKSRKFSWRHLWTAP